MPRFSNHLLSLNPAPFLQSTASPDSDMSSSNQINERNQD